MVIKIVMLVVFFAVMIAVGLLFRRKSNSVDKFVLGGRSVGPWLSAFAYGTSYFSAVVFVGYAGQFGWKFGASATWIGLGNAAIGSLLAWVILGRRTRVMTRHLGSATMPDYFARRFDSKNLKIVASLITFIFLIPYTASLYNGLSRLFSMAFNVDFAICIIVMAVLTAVYVIAGGYLATAVNDFIQGLIMIGGIAAVIIAVLRVNGGFMGSMQALGNVPDPAGQFQGVFASMFGPDPINLLGVVILTSLGTWGLPQMVQKFYSIQSEQSIKKGTIISTVFAVIVSGGCYFMGGFGRLFTTQQQVDASGFDSIIPTMLSSFSPVLIAVIVVLVLSASMSTLSSLVLASASTFTLDFMKGSIVKKMDEKRQLLTIRILIAVFILISAIIAVIQYRQNLSFIAQFMGISWGALAGAFLAPFLFGLYWKRTTKAAVWVSFIFGTLFMVATLVFKSAMPAILQSPINAGAFVMLANLVLVPLVSLVTKAPNAQHVQDVFSCYDKKVTVPVSQSYDAPQV